MYYIPCVYALVRYLKRLSCQKNPTKTGKQRWLRAGVLHGRHQLQPGRHRVIRSTLLVRLHESFLLLLSSWKLSLSYYAQ